MPTVYRVSATWSGFIGAPGFSQFAFTNLVDDTSRNAAGAAIRQFFFAMKNYLPTGSSVLVSPAINEYDVQTGVLTGASTMSTPPAVVTSTASAGQYAGGSGFVFTWKTSVIFHGHRVAGRTFFVPMQGGFAADGTLDTIIVPIAQAAGDALVGWTGADFAVWSRFYTKPTPPTKPTQIDGALSSVTACSIKDAASGLRSRRL